MAINPFRVGELQLPQALRPVPIDFSPLQSIGEGIGQYRQQQQIGGILAGATGPDGQLDLNKAARDMAAAGFAGQANRLLDTALRQATQRSTQEHQRTTEDIARAARDDASERTKILRDTLEQGKTQRFNITEKNPDTDEEIQRIIEVGPSGTKELWNSKTGARPPASAAPAPASVGPRSEAPVPGASFNDRFAALGDDATAAPVIAPTRVAAVGPVALPSEPAPAVAATPTQVAQVAPVEPAPQPPPARGEPGGPPLLPNKQEQRKEFAKKLVDQQADLVKSAEVARETIPELDTAISAWKDLTKSNRFGYNIGIGPLAASGPARAAGAVVGLEEEKLRQRFDTAMAALRARITAIQNKGQGSVSNFERQLYALQFPDLKNIDPKQIEFLEQLKERGNQTISAAKQTPLGSKSTLLNQEPPSIGQPKSDSTFDEKTLAKYKVTPAAAMARARDLLKMGADPARVKTLLDEVDTSLAKRMGL